MSGGRYDYFYLKLDEFADDLANSRRGPLIAALASHLKELAKIAHKIEWADSGDTAWDDKLDEAIRRAIAPDAELNTAILEARQVLTSLTGAIAEAEKRARGERREQNNG